MEHPLQENIDDYLMGNMSAKTTKDFETQMEVDDNLKQYTLRQQELISGMKAYQEKQDFLKMLGEIKEEKPASNLSVVKENKEKSTTKESSNIRSISTAKKRKSSIRRILAVAASVSLLIGATFFLMRPPAFDGEVLAQQQFAPYPDKLSARFEASGAIGEQDIVLDNLLKKGITAYNERELLVAKQNFHSFKEKTKRQTYQRILTDFYLAQIAIIEKDYSNSIELLAPLALEKGLPIGAAIHWYLGLSYLSVNQILQAKESFNQIPSGSEFHVKAQTLLSNLE